MKHYNILLALLILVFTPVFGQQNIPDGDLGVYEHLDDYLPEDLVFTNLDGQEILLKDIIDKPTVLSFVYFNCPGICSPLLGGITEVIERSDMQLGKDYQVVTISFDPTDTPELGIQKKENYIHSIKDKVDTDHWIWLVGDQENITKATDATGFKYIPQGKDFIHAATIIAISPDGKITRYLHGTYFLPFDLKMSMVEAGKGISSPTVNRVLEFCFSYDPQGKKYVFNVTRVAGIIILFLALVLLVSLFLMKKKNKTSHQS